MSTSFYRYCKNLGGNEVEELKNFAVRRKKNVLGRGTVLTSDENKICKEVRAKLITKAVNIK